MRQIKTYKSEFSPKVRWVLNSKSNIKTTEQQSPGGPDQRQNTQRQPTNVFFFVFFLTWASIPC